MFWFSKYFRPNVNCCSNFFILKSIGNGVGRGVKTADAGKGGSVKPRHQFRVRVGGLTKKMSDDAPPVILNSLHADFLLFQSIDMTG